MSNITETKVVSDWKTIEDNGSWKVKQREIIIPSTENIQECNICGKEMKSFIVDHIRREHGVKQ